MASTLSAAASLQSTTFLQPKLEVSKSGKSFGVKAASTRVSCSLENGVQKFVKNCAEASKATAVAFAAAALIGSGSPAIAETRLTFDEVQSQTYSEVKGTGTANQCPILDKDAASGFPVAPGNYTIRKFCMEPTSFTVKSESPFKGSGEAFQRTKLMTRLTYTLDEMEGPLTVSSDGTVSLKETDGIDYAAVTVQLQGGERVPFLFTVKELDAAGTADKIVGTFTVPSYRGATFLDPKGRGGATGYDNAVALPAGGRGDEEELGKENAKNTASLKGNIVFSIAQTNPSTGEIAGVFTSIQPSDTDLGAKTPKDVKIEGIFYGQLD